MEYVGKHRLNGKQVYRNNDKHYYLEGENFIKMNELVDVHTTNCVFCGDKLSYREIVTIQSEEMAKKGHHNADMYNHWAFGCHNREKSGCFEMVCSEKEEAKEKYYKLIIAHK